MICKRLTNLYWVEIETKKYKLSLKSYFKPRPLVNYSLANDKVVAGINFGSFYLSSDSYTNAKYCNLLV